MREVDREREWTKVMVRIGEFISMWDRPGGPGLPEGAELVGVSVRLPAEDKPETLLVLKASVGGERYVAFVGALTLSQAVLTWRAKSMAGSLKWREDVPYGER